MATAIRGESIKRSAFTLQVEHLVGGLQVQDDTGLGLAPARHARQQPALGKRRQQGQPQHGALGLGRRGGRAQAGLFLEQLDLLTHGAVRRCRSSAAARRFWQRVADDLRAWRAGLNGAVPASNPQLWRAAHWRAVAGLSPATLKDIGAPEWVAESAQVARHRDDALWR